MPIRIKRLEHVDFRDFLDAEQLLVVVEERTPNEFVANFAPYAEIKDRGMFRGCYGVGKTPNAALNGLIHEIRGEVLVFNAYSDKRREVRVPACLEEINDGH